MQNITETCKPSCIG